MHNLQTERFFKPQMINGRMASADGPIKTFPLRGIKDSPPYLHDGRLLTLEDTVEFFNLVLGTKLTARGEGRPRGVYEVFVAMSAQVVLGITSPRVRSSSVWRARTRCVLPFSISTSAASGLEL